MKLLVFLGLALSPFALAQPFYLGDSIAHGYRQAAHAKGITKVGASPSAVLKMVQRSGHPSQVVLSSGISNNCKDWKSVQAQLKALKGSRVILLGNNNCAGANAKLVHLCLQNRNCAFYPIPRGRDGVHPGVYNQIKL